MDANRGDLAATGPNARQADVPFGSNTEVAQRILRMALDAFARPDVNAAVEIVAVDDELDAAFGSILRQLISYMMEDPRTIGASIEIVFMAKSIERIGDHAKNVAEAVVQAVKGTDVRHQSAAAMRAEVEAK